MQCRTPRGRSPHRAWSPATSVPSGDQFTVEYPRDSTGNVDRVAPRSFTTSIWLVTFPYFPLEVGERSVRAQNCLHAREEVGGHIVQQDNRVARDLARAEVEAHAHDPPVRASIDQATLLVVEDVLHLDVDEPEAVRWRVPVLDIDVLVDLSELFAGFE